MGIQLKLVLHAILCPVRRTVGDESKRVSTHFANARDPALRTDSGYVTIDDIPLKRTS